MQSTKTKQVDKDNVVLYKDRNINKGIRTDGDIHCCGIQGHKATDCHTRRQQQSPVIVITRNLGKIID